jgi:hypothetical protein
MTLFSHIITLEANNKISVDSLITINVIVYATNLELKLHLKLFHFLNLKFIFFNKPRFKQYLKKLIHPLKCSLECLFAWVLKWKN